MTKKFEEREIEDHDNSHCSLRYDMALMISDTQFPISPKLRKNIPQEILSICILEYMGAFKYYLSSLFHHSSKQKLVLLKTFNRPGG